MAIIITCAVQKGGVGKTTTVVNLAHALASEPFNKRVLVVDVDPQANASATLGTIPPAKQPITSESLFDSNANTSFQHAITQSKYENVDLIPANIDLFNASLQLAYSNPAAVLGMQSKLDKVTMETYDFILIDCPPNLGGPFITNSIVISDYFIMPIKSADLYALQGVDQFLNSVNAIKTYAAKKAQLLGVLITLHNERTNAALAMEELVVNKFGNLVFDTRISMSTSLEQATLMQQSALAAKPRSSGARDYKLLAAEVLQRCGLDVPRVEAPTVEEDEPIVEKKPRGRRSSKAKAKE